MSLEPKFAVSNPENELKNTPTAFKSFLPIIIPLVLIVMASIAKYPTQPFGNNLFTDIILFLGSPVIALLLGTFLSFTLPAKYDKKLLSSSGWIGEAILIAAPVILITGAGGVFGKMLQNSGIGDLVSSSLSGASWEYSYHF
ncbi:hypothetical protein [Algoriphagus halophilus]|uniref:GntT/GntP/DsdX family permease n=1 Tax=Algoriphagus halophilus TaxID=226505 RepID=UPI00358EC0CB